MLNGIRPEQTQEVLEEIGLTSPAMHQECIDRLNDWMRSQPHMPQNFDERVLAATIRNCKHNVERAKRKLENYYTARSKFPEFFTQRDPVSEEIRTVKKYMSIIPLADTTPTGARVTLNRIMPTEDLSDYNANSVYKLMMMIGDIRMVEEGPLAGDIFLYDIKHTTLSQLAQHSGPALKRALNIAQEAYPQRLKQIHIINAPPFAIRLVNLCKQFMKEKMRNRFFFHENLESLYKYIPREILPREYGGPGKTLQQLSDQWDKKLESYASYFIQQEGVRSDERKRPHVSNDVEKSVLEGTVGCFRKLCID